MAQHSAGGLSGRRTAAFWGLDNLPSGGISEPSVVARRARVRDDDSISPVRRHIRAVHAGIVLTAASAGGGGTLGLIVIALTRGHGG